MVRSGRNLRFVSHNKDIFQTCFMCLSHDFVKSFFQHNFCQHGVSNRQTNCGIVSAHHVTVTACGFFICSFSHRLVCSLVLLSQFCCPKAYCTCDFRKSPIFLSPPFPFLHVTFLSMKISILNKQIIPLFLTAHVPLN